MLLFIVYNYVFNYVLFVGLSVVIVVWIRGVVMLLWLLFVIMVYGGDILWRSYVGLDVLGFALLCFIIINYLCILLLGSSCLIYYFNLWLLRDSLWVIG